MIEELQKAAVVRDPTDGSKPCASQADAMRMAASSSAGQPWGSWAWGWQTPWAAVSTCRSFTWAPEAVHNDWCSTGCRRDSGTGCGARHLDLLVRRPKHRALLRQLRKPKASARGGAVDLLVRHAEHGTVLRQLRSPRP